MSRNTLFSVILVLLATLGGWYALSRPTGGSPSAPLPLPTGKYEEHAAYYDIVANYATSTPLAEPANTEAVRLMQNFIADTVAEFKANGKFDALTPTDIHMMGYDQGRKQSLDIKYLYGHSGSSRVASYIYTIYMDTLGAHGNTTFKTFNFDTKSGKELSLDDVFLPGSSYLNALSSRTRVMLAASLKDDATPSQITAGTTPDAQNFADFFFDNAYFVILFPPYQVAAYAAGPQTVRIPLTDLNDILKPEYR